MKFICLENAIRFSLGKNPTRINANEQILYGPEDFEGDLNCVNEHDDRPECIINLMKSKAAPVSPANREKCITSNFLRCEFDSEVLDKWYLCYQFNEGKELKQQIAMFHQGTTLSVKKLNVKNIGRLKIRLLEIEKQKKIGELYRQFLIHNRLLVRQAEDMRRLTMAVLKKMEEE